MEENKLTEKQKRFIDYYVETGNASEAARRAGYRGDNMNKIGSENLTKLGKYIKARMEPVNNERIASANEVLEYLTSVLRGQEKDQFGLDASLKDRNKAAELLGKRYTLFTDKQEIDNNIANKNGTPFKADFSHLSVEQIKELLRYEDKGGA